VHCTVPLHMNSGSGVAAVQKSIPALWSTHRTSQWVSGVLFPGVKQPVREADHSVRLLPKPTMKRAIG